MTDLEIKALVEERDQLLLRVAELTASYRRVTLESASQSALLRRKEEQLRIAELRAQQERLTGLFTRDHFEDRVDQVFHSDHVRRAHDPTHANVLVILDIDRFKHVNDTYGHPAGDKVLAALGTVIKRAIREKDLAARFGGDEFVIFFRDTPPGFNVEQKVIAIRTAFEQVFVSDGDEDGPPISHLASTFSYGIAVESDELNSFATLYQHADQELYAQKRGRRSMKR